MRKTAWASTLLVLATLLAAGLSGGQAAAGSEQKLAEWIKGVWINGNGTYTVYTDEHYIVVSFEGDTTNPNIYCAVSQVAFHEKGMARKQVARMRQSPGGSPEMWRQEIFRDDHTEEPLELDMTQWSPGVCNIKDGIIYDSIDEVGDEYIVLATCGGDKIKVTADGVYSYLPASGGEYRSYRIERL